MARTWPITRPKRIVLAAIDAIGGAVTSLARRGKSLTPGPLERILVVELWHIGDVVLVTPLLRRLRQLFPTAHVTLLAKPQAEEVLRHSGLVDELVPFDFPWTATRGKYDLARYDRPEFSGLMSRLRAARFDLSIDCRMDLRSNILTRAAGARRRIGYDFGGGGFLLTDAVPAAPDSRHKVEDWLELLSPLGVRVDSESPPNPELVVTPEERDEATRLMRAYGFSEEDLVVAVHPGGSSATKRWAAENFSVVAAELVDRHDAKLLVLVNPDGCGADMRLPAETAFVRTSIREMMALLEQSDMLLCNDSGPMHIATALGVPVVAVFRTGNPGWYGPRGIGHIVVGKGAEWGNVTEVTIEDVMDAADTQLRRVAATQRASRRVAT
ncbi:MAG: glycosyltransferase family 9 protein [Gemmatimonadaceae bacterium]|nr:glycosyltransferase family 9 protein [Gemmatimonadaceae bacterium]